MICAALGMPKFGSVRFFQNFAERRTFGPGNFAERGTGPSVQVREGPVQVQQRFEQGTERFHLKIQNLFTKAT